MDPTRVFQGSAAAAGVYGLLPRFGLAEQVPDWYNYVKGHNPSEYFGIYDVVRLDTVWLDKA